MEAAIRLFGRDGFDATSLRAVAEDAEVSWGLIRHYFGSKEGLLDAAEELVLARYLGLVTAGAAATSMDAVMEAIDSDTHLSDDARFLRRALIEERPIAQNFVQRLIAVQQDVATHGSLVQKFPEAASLVDPVYSVATRLGYLILAPQFKTLLGRDVFSAAELKLRNLRSARERELILLGLETERQRKRNGAGVPSRKK